MVGSENDKIRFNSLAELQLQTYMAFKVHLQQFYNHLFLIHIGLAHLLAFFPENIHNIMSHYPPFDENFKSS